MAEQKQETKLERGQQPSLSDYSFEITTLDAEVDEQMQWATSQFPETIELPSLEDATSEYTTLDSAKQFEDLCHEGFKRKFAEMLKRQEDFLKNEAGDAPATRPSAKPPMRDKPFKFDPKKHYIHRDGHLCTRRSLWQRLTGTSTTKVG